MIIKAISDDARTCSYKYADYIGIFQEDTLVHSTQTVHQAIAWCLHHHPLTFKVHESVIKRPK